MIPPRTTQIVDFSTITPEDFNPIALPAETARGTLFASMPSDCRDGACGADTDKTHRCFPSNCDGLGCNAGGNENCRFCGFGQFSSIACPLLIASADGDFDDMIALMAAARLTEELTVATTSYQNGYTRAPFTVINTCASLDMATRPLVREGPSAPLGRVNATCLEKIFDEELDVLDNLAGVIPPATSPIALHRADCERRSGDGPLLPPTGATRPVLLGPWTPIAAMPAVPFETLVASGSNLSQMEFDDDAVQRISCSGNMMLDAVAVERVLERTRGQPERVWLVSRQVQFAALLDLLEPEAPARVLMDYVVKKLEPLFNLSSDMPPAVWDLTAVLV